MARRRHQVDFLARTILTRLHEDTLQAGRHGAKNVGLCVVADHDGRLGRAADAVERRLEERRGRLAENDGLASAGIFQRLDERPGIEAECAVESRVRTT